ncbi:archaeal ATPase [Candidatus Magnetomorum sp. HK-1]|nr:archaeal ATPase [Candidatus Magnetomorum sp. HK-1]
MKMNPFIYNTPVRGDDFCNRVDTIQRLLNQTVTGKSQGNVWLVGERQVGKTSLLRYIQLAYEDFNERIHIYGSTETVKVAFIYFNCQTLKNPDDYYHHIYQSLINHFDFKHTEQENAYSCYIETFKRAYASNYYIVLLLDEFDAFLKRLIQKNADQAEYLLSDINKMSQAFSEIKIEPKVFGCIFAANYTLSALVEKINVPVDTSV